MAPRCAVTRAGSGAMIDVAGGTGLPDAGSSDRQKPFTAAWLGMAMPAALTKNRPRPSKSSRPATQQMAEGDATSSSGKSSPSTRPADARDRERRRPGVRDIRVIDVKPTAKGAPTGTFTVTTTRATTPAIYDLVISANLMVDGQREIIISRAIPFEVLKGASR